MMRALLLLLVSIALLFIGIAAQQAFTSNPTYQWSFTNAPTSSQLSGGTAFNWVGRRFGFGQNQHYGIAWFNGVGGATGEGTDYINFQTYPDDNGNTWPVTWGGGPFSIEMWVNTDELNSNARYFESGNYAASTMFDTVELYNQGQGNNLVFQTTVQSATISNVSYYLNPSHVFQTGTWQHVVITVAQPSLTDSTSTSSSVQTAYSNGVIIPNYSGAVVQPITAPLPPSTSRSYTWFGKSQSSAAWYYQGYLDSFTFYNYALAAKQVAVHYQVPRVPIFDLAFGSDPRPLAGTTSSAASYSWSAQPSSSDAYHVNVLQLSTNQYVNLATATGANSVATVLPTFGGAGSGNSSSIYNPQLTAGWTFETTIQITTATANAAIFDLARTGDVDEVELEFGSSSSTLQFYVSSSTAGSSITIPVSTSVTTGVWYHIVLVATSTSATAYLNGVNVSTVATNGVTIGSYARALSYIGKSNENTNFAAFYMESLRIYDYALSPNTIANVYRTYSAPVTPTPQVTNSPYPSSTSPTNLWTFDQQPIIAPTTPGYDTNFTWVQGSSETVTPGTVAHYGLAEFDGIFNGLSWLDLTAYPDVYGNVLPASFGGSMTWEAWVNWDNVMQWARIFDLGGAQGAADNNIYLAAIPSGSSFYWYPNIYYGSPSDATQTTSTLSTTASATALISNHVWYHVVVSIGQVNRGVQNGSSSATMTLYINGQQIATSGTGNNPPTGGAYLPQNVSRPSSYAARSNWPADARFQGWMDMIAYYPYALDSEAVLAHSVLTVPPVFELTFANNPLNGIVSQSTGNTAATALYGWSGQSSVTANNASVNGILTLSGNGQYVNLSAGTGSRSVGTILPVIGGAGSGTNTNSSSANIGWSIELAFNAQLASTNGDQWAKLIDWGVGQNADEIIIGWDSNLNSFGIQIGVGQVSPSPDVFISNMVLNQWYHVVVVIEPMSGSLPNPINATATGISAIYTFYVNGAFVSSVTNRNWPRPIPRGSSLLGGSNWGDPAFVGQIHAVRVYDYALSADTISNLYSVVMSGPLNIPIPVYNSGPTTAWTFDVQPTQADRVSAGTTFSWAQSAASDANTFNQFAHYGLVSMTGASTSGSYTGYVDLYNVYDSNFQTLPNVIGGSISFEMWIQYDALVSQGQIFDIGNGAASNNILMGDYFATNDLFVDFYPSSPYSSYHQQITNGVQLGQWQHIVYSSTQVNNQNSATAASATVYINGKNASTISTSIIEQILRSSAKLGVSAWSGDTQFNGLIDSFYYYNYALSADAAAMHYVLPRPPFFEATFAVDPRNNAQYNIPGLNQNSATFGWIAFDPNDVATNLTQYHTGLLNLNASASQYVNLCAGRGANSIGTVMGDIGGPGYVQQPQMGGPYIRGGWSFEIVFKPLITGENYAKIIDFGNGPAMDNIVLGYFGSSATLQFQIFDARDALGVSGTQITLCSPSLPASGITSW